MAPLAPDDPPDSGPDRARRGRDHSPDQPASEQRAPEQHSHGRHPDDYPEAGPHAWGAADEAGLNELLADAERTVERLRAELAHRQRARAQKERNAAQHAEIDRLAEHLANAQVHWGQVRSFFEAALAELHDQDPRAD